MITFSDQRRLLAVLQRDWNAEVASESFRAICTGKERGHRIADYAEERTVQLIQQEKFPVAFEHGKRSLPRTRSMGDIWLASGSPRIYNPINIKAGITASGGAPNMVSLEKLAKAFVERQIDSYWLLLIRITSDGSAFGASVMMVNIFDYLDFMSFDAGPGQVMLRSDLFYAYVKDGGLPRTLEPEEIVDRMIEMRRDGNRRLRENRMRSLTRLENRAVSFDPTLPIVQSSMNLQVPDSATANEENA